MRSTAVQHAVPALQKLRLPDARKILVAVSGGVDSMVLLHLLERFSAMRRWKLVVAHFNHHLRGRASDADEALVRKTAAAMKLPCIVEGADVKKFAAESKISVEMAARKLRHEFFARAARQRKINTVALAHHADDQVELFFLRLFRGSGGGLGGMKWRSPSPADGKISLVRPLLDCTKAELEGFANENKIRYRKDATNSSSDFLRNRIRHELLPLLRRHYQPGLGKAVLRVMEIAGAESDLTVETARRWLDGTGTPNQRGRAALLRGRNARGGAHPYPSSRKGNFEKLPLAVQRQVLKLQLAGHGIVADFDLIESLRQSANQFVSIGVGVSVSRDAKGLVKMKEQGTGFAGCKWSLKLDEPGAKVLDGVKLKWSFNARHKIARPFTLERKMGAEFFDADKIGKEIVLRHWRAGDRFQPIGFKSSTKLQDVFTNQKIPRERRHQLLLAEARGEIFWVEGLRISENFKVTPETTRTLKWSWER